MTPVLSREEEESREPEITLSTASLLGLFLGLVLVCGIFFGFGYSVGRRATANIGSSAPSAANSTGAEDADAESSPPKSSAVETPEVASDSSSSAPSEALPEASSADTGDTTNPAPQPAAKTNGTVTLPVVETTAPNQKIVQKLAAHVEAAPAARQAVASSSRTEVSRAMVQVAAVVHQEDADVLVAALRRLGYTAVVRSGEPQDKLLHVQVGPFATRMQANAMKQKLASNGYNAIIKQ